MKDCSLTLQGRQQPQDESTLFSCCAATQARLFCSPEWQRSTSGKSKQLSCFPRIKLDVIVCPLTFQGRQQPEGRGASSTCCAAAAQARPFCSFKSQTYKREVEADKLLHTYQINCGIQLVNLSEAPASGVWGPTRWFLRQRPTETVLLVRAG